MSIENCHIHGVERDTDFEVECPYCLRELDNAHTLAIRGEIAAVHSELDDLYSKFPTQEIEERILDMNDLLKQLTENKTNVE